MKVGSQVVVILVALAIIIGVMSTWGWKKYP